MLKAHLAEAQRSKAHMESVATSPTRPALPLSTAADAFGAEVRRSRPPPDFAAWLCSIDEVSYITYLLRHMPRYLGCALPGTCPVLFTAKTLGAIHLCWPRHHAREAMHNQLRSPLLKLSDLLHVPSELLQRLTAWVLYMQCMSSIEYVCPMSKVMLTTAFSMININIKNNCVSVT